MNEKPTSPSSDAEVRTIAAVIVAAGRGVRAGGSVPKQFQKVDGQYLLSRTIDRFAQHTDIASVVVVVGPSDADHVAESVPDGIACVVGGATRAASVTAGLAVLPDNTTHVLIHDGARPLVPVAVIDRVIKALETSPGAAPALSVTDALWRADGGGVKATVSRDGLFRAQTPQGFALAAIRAAHSAYTGAAADDVEVAIAAGLDVAIVEGDEDNLKVTRPGDFALAERVLGKGTPMDVRLGNGYDVHRFGPGDHVMLCGVQVPHPRGLQGHSDADVGMHAITDAIYGALAMGDIGRHFPPSDPQWKGAKSEIFLRHAAGLAGETGFRIANVDCTLVCEQPKVGPHAEAMQQALSEILEIEPGRISVKATTSERLGFTGREEGIAALATATLVAA